MLLAYGGQFVDYLDSSLEHRAQQAIERMSVLIVKRVVQNSGHQTIAIS